MFNCELPAEDRLIREMLFCDLSQPAQVLFNDLRRLDCGFVILYFLRANSTTRLTVDDIAYRLSLPVDAVQSDLGILDELGLVDVAPITNPTLYALTPQASQQKLVNELWQWQAQWVTRIKEIQQVIWGKDSAQWRVNPQHINKFSSGSASSDKSP